MATVLQFPHTLPTRPVYHGQCQVIAFPRKASPINDYEETAMRAMRAYWERIVSIPSPPQVDSPKVHAEPYL